MFARTPQQFQQGYSLFLPARLAAKGVASEQITIEELGYRPYSVLFTTDKMIKENPELEMLLVKDKNNSLKLFSKFKNTKKLSMSDIQL